MLRRLAIVIALGLLLVRAAVAQVELSVPAGSFKSEDRIQAKVTNKSGLRISYCVQFGQGSPHAGTLESTPVPFHVERNKSYKWNVLINGPDVGSSRRPITQEAGTSNEFPFRLNDTGQMRLVLYYWPGDRSDVCDESAKGRKTAKSKAFSITGN
jgi:hypothetical protein